MRRSAPLGGFRPGAPGSARCYGRLESSHGVAAQRLIVNGVERSGGVDERGDRRVVEFGKFGEEEILVAELGEFGGDSNTVSGESLLIRRTAAVEIAH